MSLAGATVPRLHVVTDDEVLERPDVLERGREVLAAGTAVALHVRGPATGARRLWELTRRLRPAAATSGARLMVSDRVDVARLARADGVHLGGRSLSVAVARRLLSGGALVGVSVHDREAAAEAAADGADYLVVGTIFRTPSHPGRPGAGPGLLRTIAAAVPLPLVAIGGVTPGRVGACLDAGAHGVAVLRGVWEASDTERAVSGYLEAMGAAWATPRGTTGGAPARGTVPAGPTKEER